MLSALLLLVLTSFGNRGEVAPVARPVVCPQLIGGTVAAAKTRLANTGIDLKIRDPLLGTIRDPDPGGADDGEHIINQFPKNGHAPYSDPVTGYYVAVILDPGGESTALSWPTYMAIWANLIVSALILMRMMRRPVNPKGPDPVPYR